VKAMTVDLTSAIYGRRAIRAYADEIVSMETVERLIDAAVQAPSSMGLQPLAAENFMLGAYGAGLGTCPIGFSRPWLRLPDTKKELGIPESYEPVFPVVVGHPAESPPFPGRRKPVIIKVDNVVA
jgi:nitroreductase